MTSVLAACDVSGPAPISRAVLTRHLDSLAIAATATGDTARASLLTDIEIPLAFGMELTHFGIAIDSLEPQGTYESNSVVWPGVAYAEIDPVNAETLIVVVAFTDFDAVTTLRARRRGSHTSAAYVSGDSIDVAPPGAAVHLTTGRTGAACHLAMPVANPQVAALRGAQCLELAIGSSDTLIVPYPTLGSVAGIEFGTQTTGVALIDPPPSQSRPARLAKASTTPFTNAALLADP